MATFFSERNQMLFSKLREKHPFSEDYIDLVDLFQSCKIKKFRDQILKELISIIQINDSSAYFAFCIIQQLLEPMFRRLHRNYGNGGIISWLETQNITYLELRCNFQWEPVNIAYQIRTRVRDEMQRQIRYFISLEEDIASVENQADEIEMSKFEPELKTVLKARSEGLTYEEAVMGTSLTPGNARLKVHRLKKIEFS